MSTDNARTLFGSITDPSVRQIGNFQITHHRDCYGTLHNYANGQEVTFKGNEIRFGGDLVKNRDVNGLFGLCNFGSITNIPGVGDISNSQPWQVKKW